MAYDFTQLKTHIEEAVEHFSNKLSSIRTGRTTPTLLDGIKSESYGVRTPLVQLASVSVEDARTLRLIVWDKTVTKAIEKAIVDADLGVSVSVDDQGVRVSFPELTAERRTLLSKLVGEKLEQARGTIRNHRADAIRELEKAEKAGDLSKDELFRLKEEVQKIIDAAITRIGQMAEKKRSDIAI